MKINFNDLEWHDAEILDIQIDRRDPGNFDAVKLFIRWPDKTKSVAIFSECYKFIADMNFGVIANEMILSGDVISTSDTLLKIREVWDKLNVDLNKLRCYKLVTSSTASKILIYSTDFSIEKE
jgi:hypothetical protein